MSKAKQKVPVWAAKGHKRPTTRREFLAHGMIPFLGATFLPSPREIFSSGLFSEALAQANQCPSSAGSSWFPFVQLDLAGGAAMMANFLPMGMDGSLLGSYSRMGMGRAPGITTEFGNVPFYADSGMLRGIRTVAAPETLERTSFLGICVSSRDDTNENFFALNGLMEKAGLRGSLLPTVGSGNSATLGRHRPVAGLAPSAPLRVNNFSSIANNINFTSVLQRGLNAQQRQRLLNLVNKLNSSQVEKLSEVANTGNLKKLVECAGIRNSELLSLGSTTVDPRNRPEVASVWGVNANTNGGDQNLVFGAMTYNTLLGQSGSSTLVMGGYDYHNQNRATTNQRDFEAGQVMGRVLQTAAVLGRPVFLVVTSDGSVGSPESETPNDFSSDRGSAGLLYVFIFHPNRRIPLRHFQMGHYTNGQAVDETTLVGSSPERASIAVLINYLALHERLGDLNQILPRKVFEDEQVQRLNFVG